MSNKWTLRDAKRDYKKSKNKTRKCTNCEFGTQSAYCLVKSTLAINNGEFKSLFCKYFTKKEVI